MFGSSGFGDTIEGGEQPGYRAYIAVGIAVAPQGEVLGIGNPIAGGIAAVDGDLATTPAPAAIVTTLTDLSAADDETHKGVVVIESSAAPALSGDVVPSTAVVIASGATFTVSDVVGPVAAAVGTSSASALQPDAKLEPLGVGIAVGGLTATADVTMAPSTAAGEAAPIYVPQEPELLPLARSWEADALETELKALFMEMFETYIRPDERYVNVLGMPQHGPRELIETSLASDGLSIYRGAESASGAGAYLLRAWRAHNPKRGTHLLETYLQLLWPNVWTASQMWQDKAEDYPTALVTEDGGNHFLTSRVNVSLPARVTSGGDLNAIQSGLRASLPARIVMELAIESEENIGIGIANAYFPGFVAQSYEGTIA